jgi:predicted phosphodiesterase
MERGGASVRVALIADVHANLPALEAVLEDVCRRHVDAIWCLGDLVGHGAFPDESVSAAERTCACGVAGNLDLKVVQVEEKRRGWSNGVPDKWLPYAWTFERLSPASRAYLGSLPPELRQEVEGRQVLLVHGSPESVTEPLRPDTPRERLGELALIAKAGVVLCAHSHVPLAVRAAGVWFNPGSVGRPYDGHPRACYAVLTLGPRRVQARHYRVEYDATRADDARRERGVPDEGQEAPADERLSSRATNPQANQEPLRLASEPAAEDSRLAAVLALAEECDYEAGHTHQVTRLALRLFDALQALHGLGRQERFWLQCAALLHDIGLMAGAQGHHKASLRIIRDSPLLPFAPAERLIIGSVARYHRAALPSERHGHYARLKPAAQRIVRQLAAILRVADGLDYTHQTLVLDLTCETSPRRVIVQCSAQREGQEECARALEKGKLLEQAFERQLVIEWRVA